MAPFGASRAGLMSVAEDDIPDSGTAQYQFDVRELNGFEDGNVVNDWTDTRISDVTASGSATYRENVLNGYSMLEFDGSDDGFVSAEGSLTNAPVAVIAVVAVDSLPADRERIIGYHTGNNRTNIGANSQEWEAFGGGSTHRGSGSTDVNLVSVWNEVADPGDNRLREDGSQTSEHTGDNTEGLEPVSIGYTDATDDTHWSEMIGFVEYHENISESELAVREQEIADYWGISI